MKCQNEKILTMYLDHQLAAEKAAMVEEHIGTCSHCREEVKRIHQDIDFIGEKLGLLRPEAIPQKEFARPETAPDKANGFVGAVRHWFDVSIQVPITAMMIFILILAALIVGLVLQNRELSRIKKPYLIAKQEAEFILLDEVAEGYEPVEEPRIFVAREEKE
jgi:anti-sigma factor RsiW